MHLNQQLEREAGQEDSDSLENHPSSLVEVVCFRRERAASDVAVVIEDARHTQRKLDVNSGNDLYIAWDFNLIRGVSI